MAIRRIVDQMWHMVVEYESPESNSTKQAYRFNHIAIPLIDEAFIEVIRAALHIAQVNI